METSAENVRSYLYKRRHCCTRTNGMILPPFFMCGDAAYQTLTNGLSPR